jgi:hypothetical protein
MTPQLGKELEPCAAALVEEQSLKLFEDFIRFSAGNLDKYKVVFSGSDLSKEAHERYIAHIAEFAGNDLEAFVIEESGTATSYERILYLSGVLLTERSLVDETGVVVEMSYEAEMSDEPQTDSGVGALALQGATTPSVEA